MSVTLSKRYQIDKLDKMGEYKTRFALTHDIHALIYFYPPKKFGIKNYIASDVQLQIQSKQFKYNDDDIIEVIWKCGDLEKSQSYSIRQHIEPNSHKAIGIHALFTKQHVNMYQHIIKINCSINRISSSSSSSSSVKKRKQMTLFDYPPFKKMKINTSKETTKKFEFLKDWRLPSNKLKIYIAMISDNLEIDDLFDLLPTIDCFSTETNYQKICTQYITKKENFFDPKYDDIEFWTKHVCNLYNLCNLDNLYNLYILCKVAWCNPPCNKKIIIDCINKFKIRRIKGYVCIPKKYNWFNEPWIYNTKKLCKTYIIVEPLQTKYKFEVAIFYFELN